MNANTTALAIAADLNKTHTADGRHAQLVRELSNEIVRETQDGRCYATPSGDTCTDLAAAIAAWRHAAS